MFAYMFKRPQVAVGCDTCGKGGGQGYDEIVLQSGLKITCQVGLLEGSPIKLIVPDVAGLFIVLECGCVQKSYVQNLA